MAAKQETVIKNLFTWFEAHGRHDLPWRRTKEPYHIAVSEFMLQQTQVSRAAPKFEAFITQFPTVEHLASAQRTEVLQAWQGLGYNSRAVRLHALAKLIAEKKTFPQTREELLKLPGIGPYTAGAIVIFAHEQPAISVDINVERILRRVFYSPKIIPTRKELDELALELITKSGKPAEWHSAIMDLGATICIARNPRCEQCPLYEQCNTRGVHPGDAKKEQREKYVGSSRWWRGQVLKQLLRGAQDPQKLAGVIVPKPTKADKLACKTALAALVKEHIAQEKGKKVQLRK